jgi:uncharacterized membrane protein YuzA (DUF378 family)
MKTVHMVAYMLLWVGGLNWGLIGLFNFNLVEMVLGSMPGLVMLVYVLVGASAVFSATTHIKECKVCSSKK